jgi:hypothetical protein
MATTSKARPTTARPSDPADCERRAWLQERMGSPEGEFLLCTDCGDGATTGCVCHTVCRTCGNDDLIRVCPVSWAGDAEGEDAQPL